MAEPKPFSEVLFGYLDRAEMLCLLALVGSLCAHYAGISGATTGAVIALGGLGGIYFLMAYRPPAAAPAAEGQKAGVSQLLTQTILPKVLWISCAVGAVALMIYHTGPANEGYKEMMLIQSITTILGVLLVLLFVSMGVEGARNLLPVLYRALPLTLCSVYTLTA